ncbi:MAG: chorismate synthase [Muribaculaceae bacterium]|nr:chorismate synthase [Muribaculaceae bacterium]
MNSFGTLFRLTTFGESHGVAMGGVIDGCPPGVCLDIEEIQREVDRRRPGTSTLTTARRESDRVEWLSGISAEGATLGTPIGFIVRNADQRSGDYDALRDCFRPNHADYTYVAKYGLRDHRGGGRASARETVCRVAGGAVARQWLATRGITVRAAILSVGPVKVEDPFAVAPGEVDAAVAEYVELMRAERDSAGGIVTARICGLPAGLGEPVGDKFHARLGSAMLSINAAMGFEYGEGFGGAALRGSEMADEMAPDGRGGVEMLTNHCGGVNGGITNGAVVTFRVAFKPTPTIARPLRSVDSAGNAVTVDARGRHDPCVVIRAVPVVEAMACLTVADMLLMSRR